MLSNNRVGLQDTVQDALVKMVEGNPGAITVLLEFLKRNPDLGLIHILKLDDLGIYGSHIWMLWKDVCGQDAPKFDDMLINNKAEETIRQKKFEDIYFAKEWQYYA